MLPKIPYKMAKNKSQIVAMRGINYSNMLSDGDMADSKNISARSYPYITTRKGRVSLDGGGGAVTAMTVFQGKIVLVRGRELVYDGEVVGTVTPGEKQFAVINTKLVIMPDKIYFDGQTGEICNMGAQIFSKGATFAKDSITVGETSYSVAEGKGSFSGNTFTAGQTQLWSYGATFYTDGSLSFNYTTYCQIADKNTIYIHGGLPYEVQYRLTNASVFLASGGVSIISGAGISQSEGVSGNKVKLVVDQEISEDYNGKNVSCSLHIKGVFRKGDEITLTIGDEQRVRAIAISNTQLDTTPPAKTVSVATCDIKKENFADLTTLLEVGWQVAFSNNSSGIVTAITHNTLTIDGEFETGKNSYTTISRIFSSGPEVLRVGDFITISGSAENDMTFGIDKIEGNVIYSENDIFTEGEESNLITIERRIPDLDYICESDNRIWGCSNANNTIYASALGDPTKFFDYSGESTDSYAVAVGSPDKFTACCRYGGGVLFFKEMKLHKVLGSYPAEYTLYSYDIEGVQDGCAKSLQIINEVLYYKGVHGVFAFNGSPNLISANLGEKEFNKAVAGNDGDTYYLSMDDGERGYLFAYETRHGLWVLEDDLKVSDFAKVNSLTYMLCEDGKFYLCGIGESETDIEWFVQFAPLYETIDGKKSYSRIVLRIELPQKSYLAVDVRADGGAWREVGKVIGKREGIVPVSVPINRCDKFEIRLRGKGKCTIYEIKREFFVGGDK